MILTSSPAPPFRAATARSWLRGLPVLLLAAITLPAAPARAGDSMRYGSRLIAAEARAAELLAICGEPAYRDAWSPVAVGALADTEEWTYNFGPQQLLRVVLLRNARIVAIDSDGYGFSEPDESKRHCEPAQIVEGLSKYRLLMSCGAPLTRTVSQQVFRPYLPESRRYGHSRRYEGALLQVFREEWVYDFGPNVFMRVLTLENGRVTAVENGARGSARR
jgi:hypothetical protein